jgi:hypothetical protein
MMRATANGAVRLATTLLLLSPLGAAAQERPDPKLSEVWEPVPRVVRPGAGTAALSDAIVLFDGTKLSEWRHEDGSPVRWRVADGAFTVVSGTGSIFTTRAFGDGQLPPCDEHDSGRPSVPAGARAPMPISEPLRSNGSEFGVPAEDGRERNTGR